MSRINTPRRTRFWKEIQGFHVDVPLGSHGIYEVRHVTMSLDVTHYLNHEAILDGRQPEELPGTYTQLVRMDSNYINTVVMSDFSTEVADHWQLVGYARAHAPLKHVLINGLGLGVAIELLMPYTEQITNVEISASVIRLVGDHYKSKYGDRVNIVHCDAFDYQPPKGIRYNAVFHDIWDTITSDNLPHMRRLHRKYGRLCDWQQSWERKACERDAKAQERVR